MQNISHKSLKIPRSLQKNKKNKIELKSSAKMKKDHEKMLLRIISSAEWHKKNARI